MSRNHASKSFRIADLIKRVTAADEEERFMLHGIEIDETGLISDVVYQKHFDTLAEWAEYSVELEIQEERDDGFRDYLED